MTAPKDGLALVQEVYRRYAQGDLQYLLDVLAEDVAWRSSGQEEVLPTATLRRGRDGVLEYFQALVRDWNVERHDAQEFIGTGERIAVRTHVVVRHRASDTVIEFDKVDLLTVRDGRIHSFDEIFDSVPLDRLVNG